MKPVWALRRALNRLYIRAPEPIPKEHGRLLLLVGAAMFIASYDTNIYGFASRQIQQSFDIPERDIGIIIAIFRIGMIPAAGMELAAISGAQPLLGGLRVLNSGARRVYFERSG